MECKSKKSPTLSLIDHRPETYPGGVVTRGCCNVIPQCTRESYNTEELTGLFHGMRGEQSKGIVHIDLN